MKERILRLLNLKPSESPRVLDLLTVQFFIGIANAFINVLAFTLFIKIVDVHEIPQAYLVVAVVLLLINFLYEKLEHRFSPILLLKIVIIFYAAMLLLFWLGLLKGVGHDIVFILVVWSIVIYMLTGYAFWGLASLLFNIRESKRVFAVVGSGDIPAKLIGYIAAHFLIPVVGEENIIWFSVASLATAYILFNRAVGRKRWEATHQHHGHSQHHQPEVSQVKAKDLISFFFKKELIFAISLLSLISYNVFNLIDYTFLAEVKARFSNSGTLGTFVSMFFAIGRLIALVMKLVFTSRVIERLGVISCLFITPLALLLFNLVFLIAGNYESQYTIYIFGFMAMLTEVLRSTMQEPVFFILFQPLKENLRLKGHMISKGYMLSPSLIIVGASLIIMEKAGITISILLVIKLLLVNLLIWGTIIFFLRKSYLTTLRDSIRKGVYNIEGAHIYDQASIDILLQKVKTGRPTEIIYALKMLEGANLKDHDTLLEEQLNHPSTEVRFYAFNTLARRSTIQTEALKKLLLKENDPDIIQNIYSILCARDKSFLDESWEVIHEHPASIRKVIVTSMLSQKEFSYLHKGGNYLNDLIHSPDPKERELAVQITSELKNVSFTEAVNALVHDPEPFVKRSAIIAACKLQNREQLPYIIGLLENPDSKYLALQGLRQYGDEIFTDIRHLEVNLLKNLSNDLIKLAGKTKGSHSTRYLLQMLTSAATDSEQIVHALWTKDFTPDNETDIKQLDKLRDRFLQSGIQKVIDFMEVPEYKDQNMIKASLDSEIRNDVTSALKICAILHSKPEFNRILELIEHGENNRLYNAIEMLELVLPGKVARDLNTLFDYLLDPSLIKKSAPQKDINRFFEKIVISDSELFRPWTKALCIYSSWKNKQLTFLNELKKERPDNEPYIVQETREFVLKDTGT